MKDVYESVTCGGLDVHYQFSNVTFRDGHGAVVRRERLEHPDRAELIRRLSGWPKGLPVAMEASFGWSWLADVMSQAGLEPHLSNCYKLERMRQARGLAKTNKNDADLVSLVWGESERWWEVWLAPPEVRDLREVMRHRAGLVEIQTATKNRIHALFHRQGIFHEFSDLFGGKGRAFLGELCKEGRWKDGQLEAGALAGLRGQVQLLDFLRKQLASLAARLRKQLVDSPLTRRLKSVPGFGLILSHVLVAEIGQLERFGNSHRRLASYCLLAPGAQDTGEPDPKAAPLGRHLGQRGNRTLKWAFIEAAHGAVRKSPRFRAIYQRHTRGGTHDRNRGYIKVARELVRVVTAIWRDETMYTEVPPARPGRSGGGRGATRSGTGQPSAAMVPADQGR